MGEAFDYAKEFESLALHRRTPFGRGQRRECRPDEASLSGAGCQLRHCAKDAGCGACKMQSCYIGVELCFSRNLALERPRP